MKTYRLLLAIATVLTISVGLRAQSAEQVQTTDSVSKSDLKAELRKLDLKSAQRDALAQEEVRKQNEGLRQQTKATQETIQAEVSNISAIAEAARRKDEADRKATLHTLYGVGSAIFLVVTVLGWTIVRRSIRPVDVLVVHDHPLANKIVRKDPNISQLKEYSMANGGDPIVPFILQLVEDGLEPLCAVMLRDGLDPVIVVVNGMRLPEPGIAWDKRKQKVSQFVKRNGLHAVAS